MSRKSLSSIKVNNGAAIPSMHPCYTIWYPFILIIEFISIWMALLHFNQITTTQLKNDFHMTKNYLLSGTDKHHVLLYLLLMLSFSTLINIVWKYAVLSSIRKHWKVLDWKISVQNCLNLHLFIEISHPI